MPIKRIYIIITAVVVLAAIILLLIRLFGGSGSPQSGTSGDVSQGVSGEQEMGKISGGIPSSDMPSGDTIVLGTPSGNVTVKNFYKNALALIEGSEVILAQTEKYEIDYSNVDSSFVITVASGSSFADSQRAAEQNFLQLLNISQNDACKLSVKELGAPSGNVPLSFCVASKGQ